MLILSISLFIMFFDGCSLLDVFKVIDDVGFYVGIELVIRKMNWEISLNYVRFYVFGNRKISYLFYCLLYKLVRKKGIWEIS